MILQIWQRGQGEEHALVPCDFVEFPENTNTMHDTGNTLICGASTGSLPYLQRHLSDRKKERDQQNILAGFMCFGKPRQWTWYNCYRATLASVHTSVYVGRVSISWQESRKRDRHPLLLDGFIVHSQRISTVNRIRFFKYSRTARSMWYLTEEKKKPLCRDWHMRCQLSCFEK